MATTTNYGWTTPDNTALVKDGASAIRTLGSSVDTTVFANANAAINKSLVDAKGDLIAATAADTVSRLAIGTNGQVLTADSAEATGMKWAAVPAGGMTTLATGSLASTGNTTISSFSTSYKDLILEIRNYVNTSNDLGMRFNSDSGASQYGYTTFGGGTSVSNTDNVTYITPVEYNDTGSTGTARIWIYNYNLSGSVRPVNFTNNSSEPFRRKFGTGLWKGTAAITSITLFPLTGTISSGTYTLYGVN